MGIGTESALLNQAKKAQGETNERLDALIAEQRLTNDLLRQLVETTKAPTTGAGAVGS